MSCKSRPEIAEPESSREPWKEWPGDITNEALVKDCYLISPNLSLSKKKKKKRTLILSLLRAIWKLKWIFYKSSIACWSKYSRIYDCIFQFVWTTFNSQSYKLPIVISCSVWAAGPEHHRVAYKQQKWKSNLWQVNRLEEHQYVNTDTEHGHFRQLMVLLGNQTVAIRNDKVSSSSYHWKVVRGW